MESVQDLLDELPPIGADILRLTIWLLILMMIFVPLERLFGLPVRTIWRKGLLSDIAFYFLNNLVVKTIMILPIAVVAAVAHRLLPPAIHSFGAHLPLWGRLSAAMLVGELGFYWGHRWTHEIPFLWRFHSVHHNAEQMDFLVNTHAHPLDVVFVRLCGLVPMYVLGLGQPLVQASLDPVPLLVLLLGTLWGFFIHANLRWRLGPLEWLVSTPIFHHWHHTDDAAHINRNYASMLPFLDKLFGTCYLPAQWPTSYGTDHPAPNSLGEQLAAPLVSQASR